VKFDCFADHAFGFLNRRAGGDAARQIRHMGGVVGRGLFNDDGVAHGVFQFPYFFQPACLKMLFNVPGGNSSLGLPHADRDVAFSDLPDVAQMADHIALRPTQASTLPNAAVEMLWRGTDALRASLGVTARTGCSTEAFRLQIKDKS